MIILHAVREHSIPFFIYFSIGILVIVLSFFSINGCTESISDGLSGELYHPENWGENPQHGKDFQNDADNCIACHGVKLDGGQSNSSCLYCHHHNEWNTTSHGAEFTNRPNICKGCHGYELEGTDTIASCVSCHDNLS